MSLVTSALDHGRWLVGLDMGYVSSVLPTSAPPKNHQPVIDMAQHLGASTPTAEPRRVEVEAAGRRFTLLLGATASIVSVPLSALFQGPELIAPTLRERDLLGLFALPGGATEFGFVVDLEGLAQGLTP